MKKIIDIKTINNVVNKYKRVLINKENKPLERKKYILKILKESEIEIENEIVIFKEALYLGYDLADVFFNRR